MAASAFGQDQTVTITTTGQGESLQRAKDNALRSAIEQTFGAFISARTEILNDELVSDQIASVASGNIQSYEVLAQTQLSESQWGVTLSTVVSVTKLTSFVQSRGVQVEIQGGLFAANIRQLVLNEEAEIEAVRNMVGVLHELFQTAFDFEIEVGSPLATDATSSNWKIPLTITASANKNMELASQYLQSTLSALSLTPEQVSSYKVLNKDVYYIALSGAPSVALRRMQSFDMLEMLVGNLTENYSRLYIVDSGLDRKTGLGAINREKHRFYRTSEDDKRFYTDYRGVSTYPKEVKNPARDKRLEISLLPTGRQAAIFRYDDKRTLDEINTLTGYIVQPTGVISRAMGDDVYNPATGKTWMDRNIGALWPPFSMTDPGSTGDYFRLRPDETQKACPARYRLPTAQEWDEERLSWTSSDAYGAFNSPLKLPLAGSINGVYWSSSVEDGDLLGLVFINKKNTAAVRPLFLSSKDLGYSVRCLKN